MPRCLQIVLLGMIFSVSWTAAGAGSTRASAPARPATSTQSPHGELNIPCAVCHTTSTWNLLQDKIKFDHAHTGFALRGAHATVGCRDCHDDLRFANTPNKCQDCHADLHRRKNGAECELCHTTNGWEVSVHTINEHQDRFPLIGAHAAVDCYACHKSGTVAQFNRFGLSTECYSCHAKNYEKAKVPNHIANGYSTECQECHMSMDSWSSAVVVPGTQRRGK